MIDGRSVLVAFSSASGGPKRGRGVRERGPQRPAEALLRYRRGLIGCRAASAARAGAPHPRRLAAALAGSSLAAQIYSDDRVLGLALLPALEQLSNGIRLHVREN